MSSHLQYHRSSESPINVALALALIVLAAVMIIWTNLAGADPTGLLSMVKHVFIPTALVLSIGIAVANLFGLASATALTSGVARFWAWVVIALALLGFWLLK